VNLLQAVCEAKSAVGNDGLSGIDFAGIRRRNDSRLHYIICYLEIKMDDKTIALIEKLAEKLGTTSEHLWGVLLHQAPISGAIKLSMVVVMVFSAVGLVRFVKGKTTKPAKTEYDQYPQAEWEGEVAIFAWLATAIYLINTGAVAFGSAQGIVAAFFNPEYWALSYILGKV
jgi:hypothetical protein